MSRHNDLAPADAALQLGRAPRPLPLFLELVRQVAESDPQLARAALDGLAAYAAAVVAEQPPSGALAGQVGGTLLRHCGGSGPAVLLVPSLINPPRVLDLDPQVSLVRSLAEHGHSVYLLDWGPAEQRRDLSIAGHVTERLVPLIEALPPAPALVGYCMGGTMAIAAANLIPISKLVTIAAPWRFAGYPDSARAELTRLWQRAEPVARNWGVLPIEVLQMAFWSLDPRGVVAKYAEFARFDPASSEARRFVALEDWANQGEPLPLPVARELFEDLFLADNSGRGEWLVGGQRVTSDLAVPHLAVAARRDRIVPAATAPVDRPLLIDKGHVGMIVGRGGRDLLHRPLAEWLAG